MSVAAGVSVRDFSVWEPTDEAVLCFCLRRTADGSEEVLLIEKQRGLGGGKVNGPGGKLEDGESHREAARRETWEEVGVQPGELCDAGVLSFSFADGYGIRARIFLCRDFRGTPVNTPEAIPFWCPVSEIPYERMWADDREWLPEVLAGKRAIGRFLFFGDSMLAHELEFGPRGC